MNKLRENCEKIKRLPKWKIKDFLRKDGRLSKGAIEHITEVIKGQGIEKN